MAQKTEDLEEIPSVNLEDRPPIDLTSAKDKKPEAAPITQQQPAQPPSGWSLSNLCFFCTIRYLFPHPLYRFYRPYFEVSTNEILYRLLHSLFPYMGNFHDRIKEKPDLFFFSFYNMLYRYGPLWIYGTLAYLFSFLSNLSRYFADPVNYNNFDFSLFPISFLSIFGVGLAFPVVLDVLINGLPSFKTILENLTIYGYSYAIFIPALLLCSIPINILQWILLVYAAASSIYFLFRAYQAKMEQQTQRKRYIILGFIVVVQVTLMVLAKLCFFHRVVQPD